MRRERDLVTLDGIPFRVPAGTPVECWRNGAGIMIYKVDGLSVENMARGDDEPWLMVFETNRHGHIIPSSERQLDGFEMEQFLLARARDRR